MRSVDADRFTTNGPSGPEGLEMLIPVSPSYTETLTPGPVSSTDAAGLLTSSLLRSCQAHPGLLRVVWYARASRKPIQPVVLC